MIEGGSSFGVWAFMAINLILAALMYTLIGRFFLSIVFQPDSDKTIWVVFRRITDPFLTSTRVITPIVVPDRLVVLFSAIWVFLLRIGLFLTFLAAGYKLSGV